MFPTTFEIGQGTLEPAIIFNPMAKGRGSRFDGTGILSAKFFMQLMNDDGTFGAVKINGGAMAIIALNPFRASYAWAGTDTDTLGRYASWVMGYKGAGLTDPQLIDGVEVLVYAPGRRLAR